MKKIESTNTLYFLRAISIVLITIPILAWINQTSISNYWQLRYHQQPPWHALEQYDAWKIGANTLPAIAAAAKTFTYTFINKQPPDSQPPPSTPNDNEALSPIETSLPLDFTEFQKQITQSLTPPPTAEETNTTQKNKVFITSEEIVLFTGDSMMQGIAPHLKEFLREQHNIQSIDISKQSTGLAYPHAFNWPETIKDTLNSNPKIKVLVIFLGPNDPWDMPPEKGGTFLRFATPEWEQLYRQRIKFILETAKQHSVSVIWISPPNMRNTKLSEKMFYLSNIYKEEADNAHAIFISSNTILKYDDKIYSDYSGKDSDHKKLRSGDGIHFTPTGQRIIADAIYSDFQFQ